MTANRIVSLVIVAVVAVAAIVGLYLAGSPAEQRLVALDAKRVADLRHLSYAIRSYWKDHKTMPDGLETSATGSAMASIPSDPETGIAYEYEVTANGSYRLCADFSRPSRDTNTESFWQHESGRTCFEFDLPSSGNAPDNETD